MFGPGEAPVAVDWPEPVSEAGLSVVSVRAAAITGLDVQIASGAHAFSPTARSVLGREGVVADAAGNRFFLPVLSIPLPHGSMAEWTLADLSRALPVPYGVSDELAAAVGNAGLAAWLPLSWRGRLSPGEKVLVLGATGMSGGIAVALAATLGAGRVVAAGRDRRRLEALASHGADALVELDGREDLARAFVSAANGKVDLVLDYLNGRVAAQALEALASNGRVVQIGTAAGASMSLKALPMKVGNLEVLGFAYHHAPILVQRAAYKSLCLSTISGGIEVPTRTFKLSGFAEAWELQLEKPSLRCVIKMQ